MEKAGTSTLNKIKRLLAQVEDELDSLEEEVKRLDTWLAVIGSPCAPVVGAIVVALESAENAIKALAETLKELFGIKEVEA